MRRVSRTWIVGTAVVFASTQLGCWAALNREGDVDRTPVVNTGAGASIIYPGQSAPPHPGNYHPREAGYGQPQAGANPHNPHLPATPPSAAGAHVPQGAVAPGVAVPPPEYATAPGQTRRSGSGAAPGGGITMIGGAETEETRHVQVNEEPLWLKYVGLPFAVMAAPFKYGYEKVRGEPEPGPALPRNGDQPRPTHGPPAVDYETAQLQEMERQLAERGAPAPGAAPSQSLPPRAVAPATGGGSIADELARLRNRGAVQAPPRGAVQAPAPQITSRAPIPATTPRAAGPPTPRVSAEPQTVSGHVDRDGDGRTDHWIERENGAIVRERFDDNFDARPDKTVVYDPSSHEVIRIEEDTDHDGRLDAWTAFRNGQVVGRRVDESGDGHVDSWSSYQRGTITRLERDKDGDGFRDHIAFYEGGKLAREERDDDGDGRTDLVTHYDADEQVTRVEEDANGDGRMDVVSHYEGGRLTRRQVLDATVLDLESPRRQRTN
ncbi:MAG: hypothetical protein AAF430_16080 [Myxococcota bacterium]